MDEAAELLALYEAKARAELADADALVGAGPGARRGETMAAVALVVGSCDEAGAPPLSGESGEAVAKALSALGFDDGSTFVIASRPSGDAAGDALAGRLRLALEAVDPALVLALDSPGATDVCAAFGLAALPAGEPVVALGRTFGYVGEFAASLGDEHAKAPVWKAMKAIARANAARTSARRQSAPREKSGVKSDGPSA